MIKLVGSITDSLEENEHLFIAMNKAFHCLGHDLIIKKKLFDVDGIA